MLIPIAKVSVAKSTYMDARWMLCDTLYIYIRSVIARRGEERRRKERIGGGTFANDSWNRISTTFLRIGSIA
jgi:hypothetical protein